MRKPSEALKPKAAGKVAGKPGRKATGLRQLPPEAARLAVNAAALKAVTEAVDLQKRIIKSTGHAAPSLIRLLRRDVEVTSMRVPADCGQLEVRPVVRATAEPLVKRMAGHGFPANLQHVAVLFAADVEHSKVGKLTASYGGSGVGGAVQDHALSQFMRMERLLSAQLEMNDRARAALWAFVVFEIPLRDIGWLTAGRRLGRESSSLGDVGYLFVEQALEYIEPTYLRVADRF